MCLDSAVGTEDVTGHDIKAPGSAEMLLTTGGFAAGSDYLAGIMHGRDHEGVWEVFDADVYIGVFGAKRAP